MIFLNIKFKKNRINELQNTEEILLYLAAQRKIYSDAKTILKTSSIYSVLVTIFGLLENINGNTFFKIINFAGLFLLLRLKYLFETKRETAADMQKLVDRKLYGLDTDIPHLDENGLYKEALETKRNNVEYFSKQMKKDGYEGGVFNWYSDVSELSEDKAIICCQIENTNWDIDLREKFFKFNVSFIILFILIYSIRYRDNTLKKIIISMYPILSLITDKIPYISNHYNFLSESKSLKRYINSLYINIDRYDKNQIKEKILSIQDSIDLKRRNVYPIPDWFYNCNREKYQSFYNEFIRKIKRS